MSRPIDLSLVPPPDAVETLDIDALVAACWDRAVADNPALAGLVESDPARKWMRTVAFREGLVRQRVNEGVRACMLPTAKLNDLANLASLFGLERRTLDPGDPDASPPVPPTLESDESLLRRAQLFPASISSAGPESAYRFHALGADPRVLDVAVQSPAPCRVTVTVLAAIVADGDTGVPPQGLLDAVAAALSAESVRPAGDRVTAQAAAVVEYMVRASLTVGPGPDAATVLATARKRVAEAAAERFRLGRGMPRSVLIAALHAPGVDRVNLTEPAADVAATAVQAARMTGSEVSAA